LIMGLTVGIVITPCAAGIIIGLVGLVAKLGIVAKGTLLFFIMGLGLGLPYLFLATFSGLINKLPQSGMWMVWVKQLFGVLLIGVISLLRPAALSAVPRSGTSSLATADASNIAANGLLSRCVYHSQTALIADFGQSPTDDQLIVPRCGKGFLRVDGR